METHEFHDGRGTERLIQLIREQIGRLRDAGLAVFILCHIKLKEKTDMVSGDTYEQITNNLNDRVYSSVADGAQMVMVGVLDREIEDGKLVGEDRVLYLRGTSAVDAGSRFIDLPETIDFTPTAFLNAFEEAVKRSMSVGGDKEVTKKTLNATKKQEEKELAATAKRTKEADAALREVDEETNIDLLADIKLLYMANTTSQEKKNKVKDIMAKYSISTFKDPSVSTKGLMEIKTLLES